MMCLKCCLFPSFEGCVTVCASVFVYNKYIKHILPRKFLFKGQLQLNSSILHIKVCLQDYCLFEVKVSYVRSIKPFMAREEAACNLIKLPPVMSVGGLIALWVK